MKSNENLQKEVQEAIKREQLLNAAEIGVTVNDGVVTLNGVVDSYAKKLEIEDAVKNVAGVEILLVKIEIKFQGASKKADTEITTEVLNAFKWNWEIPSNKVKVKVEDGLVTLEGELSWNYQREAVKLSVRNLDGVKGITNRLKIKSETYDELGKKVIENALLKNVSINDKYIQVAVLGNRVKLNGTVASGYQKDEVGRIAWNAPGVWTVDNELIVQYS